MPDEHLLFHGARLDPQQTRGILDHIFQSNLKQNEAGKRGAPICIWGLHGIGKTSLVQDYAREHGWKFAYCAPAQFEEMGDLHGLPTRIDPDPDKIALGMDIEVTYGIAPRKDGEGNEYMTYWIKPALSKAA